MVDFEGVLRGLDRLEKAANRIKEQDLYIEKHETKMYRKNLEKLQKEKENGQKKNHNKGKKQPRRDPDEKRLKELQRGFQRYCDEFNREELKLRGLVIDMFQKVVQLTKVPVERGKKSEDEEKMREVMRKIQAMRVANQKVMKSASSKTIKTDPATRQQVVEITQF